MPLRTTIDGKVSPDYAASISADVATQASGNKEVPNHSIDELLAVVRRYYPRDISCDDPRYEESEEHRRLVAARRRAGVDCAPWRAMLKRLSDRFPGDSVQNLSLHLPMGNHDACYSGSIYLPVATGEHYHTVNFLISFLTPCYVVYSSRVVDDLEEIERRKALSATPPRYVDVDVFVHDTLYVLPAGVVKPEFIKPPSMEARRHDVRFDLSPDEQPYAAWIAEDIEATWAYEPMPPEIGKVVVPDVTTSARAMGEATIYDCLLSDDW